MSQVKQRLTKYSNSTIESINNSLKGNSSHASKYVSLQIKHTNMLIPVEICFYAARNRFIRPFQLFIFLKSICHGKLELNNKEFQMIATALELKSGKTIKYNIEKLKRMNWVGYSPKSGFYFIRGFDKLRVQNNFPSPVAAKFHIDEILNFKAFISGVIIGYLVKYQEKKERKSERKKGRSNRLNRSSFNYYPVSVNALAKILNISKSTASDLKWAGYKAKYFDLKKNSSIPV